LLLSASITSCLKRVFLIKDIGLRTFLSKSSSVKSCPPFTLPLPLPLPLPLLLLDADENALSPCMTEDSLSASELDIPLNKPPRNVLLPSRYMGRKSSPTDVPMSKYLPSSTAPHNGWPYLPSDTCGVSGFKAKPNVLRGGGFARG